MKTPALKIDVDAVIRARLGARARLVPRWLTRVLERIIRQDGLNELLSHNAHLQGAEFCNAILRDLDVTYTTSGPLPDPTRRNVIIVSNHPLGALDGITLIDWAASHYGCNVKFLVNDLLMAVDPLRPVFVPVNKFGRQSRHSAEYLDRILADNDTPLLIFPAGLCSRRIDGHITDLPWKKTFISRAIENQRDIIPLFFDAENSAFFYNFAQIRRRLLPKINLDMALLPREIFNSRGRCFSIRFGEPISWGTLKGGKMAGIEAVDIRQKVYSLGQRHLSSK